MPGLTFQISEEAKRKLDVIKAFQPKAMKKAAVLNPYIMEQGIDVEYKKLIKKGKVK